LVDGVRNPAGQVEAHALLQCLDVAVVAAVAGIENPKALAVDAVGELLGPGVDLRFALNADI
jgi:hypothetical protein